MCTCSHLCGGISSTNLGPGWQDQGGGVCNCGYKIHRGPLPSGDQLFFFLHSGGCFLLHSSPKLPSWWMIPICVFAQQISSRTSLGACHRFRAGTRRAAGVLQTLCRYGSKEKLYVADCGMQVTNSAAKIHDQWASQNEHGTKMSYHVLHLKAPS